MNKFKDINLSPNQLKTVCHSIMSFIDRIDSNRQYGFIQKIHTTAYTLVLKLRYPGENYFLMIGRGDQFQGIYPSHQDMPAHWRCQDQLLFFLRERFLGARLISLECLQKSKGVLLTFRQGPTNRYLGLVWKKNKLHFAYFVSDISNVNEYFFSWNSKFGIQDLNLEDFISLLNDLDPWVEMPTSEIKIQDSYSDIIMQFHEEQEQTRQDLERKQQAKKLKRKSKNIQQDLSNLNRQVKELEVLLETDLSGRDDLVIAGKKIKLNRANEHYKNRDIVYKKIKAFKKGIKFQEERLKKLLELESKKNISVNWKSLLCYPFWPADSKKTLSRNQLDKTYKYNIYDLPGYHAKLAVGSDAQGNDYLRSKFAQKEDWFFHLQSSPGAHAYLKGVENPTENLLLIQLIGSILQKSSNEEGMEISMVFAQVKNIKGLKGKRGAVLVKKPRYITTQFNQHCLSELENSP